MSLKLEFTDDDLKAATDEGKHFLINSYLKKMKVIKKLRIEFPGLFFETNECFTLWIDISEYYRVNSRFTCVLDNIKTKIHSDLENINLSNLNFGDVESYDYLLGDFHPDFDIYNLEKCIADLKSDLEKIYKVLESYEVVLTITKLKTN